MFLCINIIVVVCTIITITGLHKVQRDLREALLLQVADHRVPAEAPRGGFHNIAIIQKG